MTKLSELSEIDRAHWKLHLNAAAKDSPSVSKRINEFLADAELPLLEHPSYIHNWADEKDLEKEEELKEDKD